MSTLFLLLSFVWKIFASLAFAVKDDVSMAAYCILTAIFFLLLSIKFEEEKS